MEQTYDIAVKLLVSLAIGLLIGIERGWSDRAQDDGRRMAGVRTFSLIGLLGGVVALLSQEIGQWLIVGVFIAVSALIITAHVLDVQEDKDVGTTTAFAMMLTFVLPVWAIYGHPIPAMAVTVIVISLLGFKPFLHSWIRKISPRDFSSAATLLIISVVLLPLLPNRGYGPWEALNPYWAWWMVVLISGLSFLGYLAIKIVGEKTGTLVTAVAGALASSTAVTISLARFAKTRPDNTMFGAGVLLAGAIMFLRVLIEIAIVNPGLLYPVWIPLTMMLAGLVAGFSWLWRRHGRNEKDTDQPIEINNPLQLSTALQFGFLLAVVLLSAEAMKHWFGSHGVYVLSVVSGVMDVDAITLSLSRSAHQDLAAEVASLGIVLACVTNTVVKGMVFAGIAGFRQHYRIPLFMAVAMLPGLFIALLI